MATAEAKSEKQSDLFAVRSILFLPASNARAIAKAREAGADLVVFVLEDAVSNGEKGAAGAGAALVVLDLEDAVKHEDKAAARDAAVEAAASDWPMPLAIRINGAGSAW